MKPAEPNMVISNLMMMSHKSCPCPVCVTVSVPVNCSGQTKPEPLIKSKNRKEGKDTSEKGGVITD